MGMVHQLSYDLSTVKLRLYNHDGGQLCARTSPTNEHFIAVQLQEIWWLKIKAQQLSLLSEPHERKLCPFLWFTWFQTKFCWTSLNFVYFASIVCHLVSTQTVLSPVSMILMGIMLFSHIRLYVCILGGGSMGMKLSVSVGMRLW